MKVILTEDHDTLGLRGDVVEVKPGYGRNFLIPRQMAVIATPSAVKRYAEEKKQAQEEAMAMMQEMATTVIRTSRSSMLEGKSAHSNPLLSSPYRSPCWGS